MDPMEILLAFVVVVVTGVLVAIFYQIYLILKELRQTVVKTNRILDDTANITEAISRPISILSTMLVGIKGGSTIMKLFKR